jgi:hypothetical protein
MKREAVQDFLNLPGIAGVALIDGRSRPYFCGIDRTLNFQQKEALAQGIQQVVETTPVDFQCFQFQFIKHRVYLYKLDHDMILLVLTSSLLIDPSYQQAVELLKTELQQDSNGAIATFRLLAGSITLSDQTDWQRSNQADPTPETLSPSVSDSKLPQPPVSQENDSQLLPSVPASVPPVQGTNMISGSAAPVASAPSLKELLMALNHLSQFTTHYLGTTVATNNWKTARPAIEWLDCFQIDRQSANITCKLTPLSQPVTPEQHQWVREWVAAFVDRCSKVIRDFPLVIKQTALDDRQKTLLLPDDF